MESVNVLYVLPLVLLFGSATVKSLEFCEPQHAIQLTEFGQEIFINSPQYPDLYVSKKNCTISIDVVLHTPHVVHIEQLATDCYIPYHIVGVNVSYITCTQMTTGYLQSTDVPHNKDTTNQFKLLLQAGASDRFNLNVKAYPLVSMEPTDGTVDITTTPTTYITSHQGFPESFYSNNLHNKLTLTDIPSGYDVVVEFLYLRLGSNYNCKTGSSAGDVLRVSEVEVDSVIYECGDIANNLSPPPPLVINTANSISSLLLEFITDGSQQFQGFLLRCTAVVCGKYSLSTIPTTDSGSSSSSVSSSYSSSSYSSSSYSSSSYSSSSYSSISYSSSKMKDDAFSTTKSSEIISAAIGAGSGGMLLVIVIVVLACVLYRRSKYRERYTSNTTTENSPPAMDESFTEDERTNDGTNRYSTHAYCDVNLPTATERRSGGDSQPPDGGHTEAERGEPDGVDTNALYTPIVKVEKIEMVENSLYASA